MPGQYSEVSQAEQRQPRLPSQLQNFRARVAVCVFFFGLGWVVGHWVARIPDVKQALGMSEGLLGASLFCAAFGMLGAMPAIGWLGGQKGSRFAAVLGAVVLATSLLCIAASGSAAALMASLLVYGVSNGFHSVGMNAQAALVEAAMQRNIMGSFHAMYSVGNVVGAAVAGGIAATGASTWTHFVIASVPLAVVLMACAKFMYSHEQEDAIVLAGAERSEGTGSSESVEATETAGGAGKKKSIWSVLRDPQRGRSLLLLCLIGFTNSIGEGSVSDWSTVYMSHYLGASTPVAAAGYGAFATCMTLGRLCTDYLRERFSDGSLLKLGGLLGCSGLLVVVAAHEVKATDESWAIACAVVGLCIAGCGMSVAIPIVFSIAGQLPGISPSEALAAVTSFGYLGMLIGPPMFGGISEAMGSLQWALLVDGLLMLIITAAACGGASAAAAAKKKNSAADLTAAASDDERALIVAIDEESHDGDIDDALSEGTIELTPAIYGNPGDCDRPRSPATVAAFSPVVDDKLYYGSEVYEV